MGRRNSAGQSGIAQGVSAPINAIVRASATKGQPGGGRIETNPSAKGGRGAPGQRDNGNQASGRGPLFNNRGQQQVQQPQPISPEARQSAINERLLAAKAATGQGSNLNGTANAQSTGVGRGEATVRGGK